MKTPPVSHKTDYPDVAKMPPHIQRARVMDLYRVAALAGGAMGCELEDEQLPAQKAAAKVTTVAPRRGLPALVGGMRATA